ncbi:NUDIX hydrolase [Cryptosporangium sp. NPDC048952]|uniref:NUDIX hydrolase n=1 Tax=Cryptosporangium sp. NPDC048952 TaxID=3363961 RepID=UPI003719B85A
MTKHVVGAVIADTGGKILLLRRAAEDYLGGLWELPSGGVDDGETLTEALHREVYEETGLTVTAIEAYLGHFDYQVQLRRHHHHPGRRGEADRARPAPGGRPHRTATGLQRRPVRADHLAGPELRDSANYERSKGAGKWPSQIWWDACSG